MITYWYLSESDKMFAEKHHLKTRLNISDNNHIIRKHPPVGWHKNVVLVPLFMNIEETFADPLNNFFTNLTSKQKYWLRSFPEASIFFIDCLEVKELLRIYKNTIYNGINNLKEEFKIKNKFYFLNNDAKDVKLIDKELKIYTTGGLLYPQITYRKEFPKEKLIEYFNNFDTNPIFSKKVVSMNGRFRPSRSILINKIQTIIPQKDLYISYYGLDPGWTMDIAKKKLNSVYYDYNPKPLINTLESTPFSNYDKTKIENLYQPYNKQIYLPEPEIYNDVFIDIMTETLCERERDWRETYKTGQFITEKTTKPIIALKPFIVLASKGYLEYLRGLGFKTFSKWFNEDYDRAPYSEAIDIVEENLNYINSLSITQLYNLYKEMEDVLLHNRNNLIKLIYDNEHSLTLTINKIC